MIDHQAPPQNQEPTRAIVLANLIQVLFADSDQMYWPPSILTTSP